MKISVVTPLYQSAPYIEELRRRAIAAIRATGANEYEIVFVNDASPDDSLAVAKGLAAEDSNVIVVDLSRNFGQHKAIMTGLAYATGDYVFVMDSDLEEAPEWITLFYRDLVAQQCDVVYGISENKTKRRIYGFGRSAFYSLLNALSGVNFPYNITNARIMTRRYVDALMSFNEHEIFLGGLWHITGFKQTSVAVVKGDDSPSSYTLPRLLSLVLNAITGFSTRPLIAISIIGLLVACAGFLLLGLVLFKKFAYGVDAPGWVSVMVTILLIGGLQLVVTGIIAIYIAKIFIEVKRRPRTIVREVINNTHDLPQPGTRQEEAAQMTVSRRAAQLTSGAGYPFIAAEPTAGLGEAPGESR